MDDNKSITAVDPVQQISRDELIEEIAYLKQTNQSLMKQSSELVKVQTILQSLLHSATDPIIQFNEEGLIVNFNSAAQQVFGFSEIELMYQSAESLIPCPEKYKGNVPAFLIDSKNQNTNKDGVLSVMGLHQDGHQLCLEYSLSQIVSDDMILFDDETDEDNEVDQHIADYDSVLVILRDVSERIKSEKMLIEAIDSAEKALSIKSDFIATISHELRTPMNGIIGSLEIFKTSDLDKEQRSLVGTILRSSEGLLDIINDVLDFSKIEAGKMQLAEEPFSLAELTENTMEMFLILADENNISLNYSIAPDIPKHLIGDQVKLRQLLLNLIGNAVKFTSKGRVDVEINAVIENEQQCRLEVKVRDTGIGISKENQNKLFQPFSQLDSSIIRKFGGTGLGLSICKKIVDLMQGTIEISCSTAKGSVFTLNLPFRYCQSKEKELLFSESTFAGKRVLIMSANQRHSEILSSRCGYWGLEITNCTNIEQAQTKMLEVEFDWLIAETDQQNVSQLYDYLKQGTNNPLVILIGKNADKKVLEQTWQTLNYHFVPLPVLMTELKKSLSDINIREKISTQPDIDEINKSICITDDNAVNRTILQKILKKYGCTNILIAKNGREAVDLCQSQQVDLIFMDLQMPQLDGISATKEILGNTSSSYKKPVIIALTANVTDEDQQRCEQVGMNDFLSKPIRIEKIQKILQQYMSG